MIHATATGVEIDVRVIPRAAKSCISGERDGRVLVRLAAPPVEGAANQALVELFATLFERPKRSVRVVSGEKSRAKRVAVDGVTAADAAARLSTG